MINTPQNRTDRRIRLGGSNVLRHVGQRPAGVLSVGSNRLPVSIIGAAGFDVHVVTPSLLSIGQRATILLGSGDNEPETAVPGVVHWVDSGKSGAEAGIVLHEQIPEEFAVKVPGCQRNSIRYSCRITGSMRWKDGSETASSAVTMNYSRDGVCFRAAVVPSVETPVQFVWKVLDQERSIAGTIRWVIEQEGGFLTGCELLQETGYKLSGITI